jgi:GTPase
MSVEHMRTGDKATCKFTFIKNPEYLKLGSKIIFREGRTKAVGSITKIS